MKKFLLSMAIILMASASVLAQVPTVMMYQVMVNHGKAAAQDVTIEMQLRTSQTGSAVWSQTFDLKEVKNGSVQNLGLDFGSKVDLGTGEYWLATIVDGQEKGCAKLASVPYAMVSKRVEGVISREELIGTWNGKYEYEKSTLTFKADGTFEGLYVRLDDDYVHVYESLQYQGTWKLNGAGNIYFDIVEIDGNDVERFVFSIPTFYNAEKHELSTIRLDDPEIIEEICLFYKEGYPGADEEEKPVTTEHDAKLVGSWSGTMIEVDYEDDPIATTLTVKADGTYSMHVLTKDMDDDISGTWYTKNNVLYLTNNPYSQLEYSFRDGKVIFKDDSGILSFAEFEKK